MVFKLLMVLLSGRFSSNIAFLACFGSDFKSINIELVSNMLPGLALCCFCTQLNSGICLDSIVQSFYYWFTSDNFMISC